MLPFKLATLKTYYDLNENFTSSLFYVSVLNPDSKGDLTPFHRNNQQLAKEFKNLYSHGVTNPGVYQLQHHSGMKPASNEQFKSSIKLFIEVLQMRKDAGLKTKPVFLMGPERVLGFGATNKIEDLKKLELRVKEILSAVEEVYGHKDVYF